MKQKKQIFRVVLIKPSHYDDDGYVIQWFRSWMPTNTLSCVHGIMQEAAERKIFGPDIEIVIEAFDECSSVISEKKIIRSIKGSSCGFVMLIGVQTNQYPRALDIARPFKKAGIDVIMGGFHVSGSIAMVPDWKPALEEAQALGISLFAGELEGHADTILRDTWYGKLNHIYNCLAELPEIENAPMPHISLDPIKRTKRPITGIDLGRGCPFECSFCTIINVQGQKARSRDVKKVMDYIRLSASCGSNVCFITDDNFSRNKNWRQFLDGFIELREKEGIKMDFIIQVDTKATRIPGFIEKAKKAGCSRVFIGMESVRQGNLAGVGKNQNNVEELREMALALRSAGIITYAALIVGFPDDTVKDLEEDIRFIQENVPVDLLQFSMLTPLPGSKDHKNLVNNGTPIDPDFNRYDLEHPTMNHPEMTRNEWADIYKRAWDIYYSDQHIERVLRETASAGISISDVFNTILSFFCVVKYDNLYPAQGGLFRRKIRAIRRYGMPIEPRFRFLLKRVQETTKTQFGIAVTYWRFNKI
ncbi:MAG: radical SAM protein, partial [Planctomycetes bacterium]|nr:radical SAM protein [Planctomycetota bacterium]